MTHSEALALAEDLDDLKKLRTNRFFLRHILPEIERVRDEHRVGMRDHSLPPAERCEHISAWEDAQSVLEFADKEEQRIRQLLTDWDRSNPLAAGRWSTDPR